MLDSREVGPAIDEIDGDPEANAEEIVEQLRDDLGYVYENKANGQTLDSILRLVEESVGKYKDLERILVELRGELGATEDEDEIGQILEHYLRKMKAELV